MRSTPSPLDIVNLSFLLLGILLHRTPARLMHAVQAATPAVWGVLLQFPFYAGIAGIITGTHLSQQLAALFVGVSTPRTFPAVVAIYSAVLGVFVPSGGSKWIIEAPYVMAAAHELKVHLGWVVVAYDLGEALANLLQPFWMLPILGMLGLRARDVMGYTFVVFLVLTPVVLVLVTVLGLTLGYPLIATASGDRSAMTRLHVLVCGLAIGDRGPGVCDADGRRSVAGQGRMALLLRRQRRPEVFAARSDRRDNVGAAADRLAAAAPRRRPDRRARRRASPTTSARRR